MSSEEPLTLLPQDKWENVQSTFTKEWPRHILGYYLLEVQQRWADLGLDYGFKVYCPFGNAEYGMVGMNVKKECYEVIIQCGNDDTTKLEEALVSTNVIDWNKEVMIAYAPLHVIKCLQRAVTKVPARIDYEYYSNTFIVLKGSKPFEDLDLPKEVTIEKLKEEHAAKVDAEWPYKYETSPWYFTQIIKSGTGYGLFFNAKLVAWVVINEAGNLCNLYTLEEHRRKGYAEVLIKKVTNDLLANQKDTIAYCMEGNEGAFKLYKKLGFKLFEDVAWVYIKPKD